MHRWKEVSDDELRKLASQGKPFKPSNAQLREAIENCKVLIQKRLDRSNQTPFKWIVLDEYYADIYMYMAKNESDFDSADKRIKKFRSESLQYPTMLNLSFPVLRITDSFSGPQKEVGSEFCSMDSELKVN